jgi:alkaline phosphatase
VLTYNNGKQTKAIWEVLPLPKKKAKAKNLIYFVGDGMATSMISAARLLAHKTVNGKYMTQLQLDKAPAYGAQTTHSLDSFITDSANSATALFSG